MNSCEQILSRKRINPICNFKIVELIIDMIVGLYITDNNKQLNTFCMNIKTLSLRYRQLISVSFGVGCIISQACLDE